MVRTSALTDARLDLLYGSSGFGGETTMRAKVIRELIDEIRALRRELQEAAVASLEGRGDAVDQPTNHAPPPRVVTRFD